MATSTKSSAAAATATPVAATTSKETLPIETVVIAKGTAKKLPVKARGAFTRAQSIVGIQAPTVEADRLKSDKSRASNWKRWGPYLSERQWATVREDYSADGSCWDYLPHDHARSRAYRWGEDGLMGITDRQCRLCFSLCLWNEKDPILKERIFGLTGSQGNHGEDPKECYYYLDSTPTHSYMKGLYKYPQGEFPYSQLVDENRRRGVHEPEFELDDTDAFAKYWDVTAEYAKASPEDILIRITVANRGPETAKVHLLPTLWYRNTWIWGCKHEGCTTKPLMKEVGKGHVRGKHQTLAENHFYVGAAPDGTEPEMLWTENESNSQRLWGMDNYTPYVKDAFHRYLVDGEKDAISPNKKGTKVASHYILEVAPGKEKVVKLRLTNAASQPQGDPFGVDFDRIFETRIKEADDFYDQIMPSGLGPQHKIISRQAYAGLLWTKQFYHYVIESWLEGDPDQMPPPKERWQGRNSSGDWRQLFNRDIISMPDKWEYPWYASWDLAFHMIPFAKVDPEFAKDQLVLFLREWYMAPNGQIPAYEFAFDDVNPPVHAWAVYRVFKMTGKRGERDVNFLARCFQKLILNFNWWVNRKDPRGNNIFSGGFLGLDNIGIFDRSKPLPTGGVLEQADGTAWMAFFCVVMLDIALELSLYDPVYEDMASKFFEHFVYIVDAMNSLGASSRGLWNEEDGFYYDHLRLNDRDVPMRVRSMVGLIPLFACLVLEDEVIQKLPGFKKRLQWFLDNRPDLAKQISYIDTLGKNEYCHLLAIPSKERLERVLKYMLDEDEFLSPFGIRSLSKVHADQPFSMEVGGERHYVGYVPGESNTYVFGGNSNWRGPIWLCVNYLIIEVLERYYFYYGEDLRVECPTGSGQVKNLLEVSQEISRRVTNIFVPDENGQRPCHGDNPLYRDDPAWKDLVLFYEYFNGDNGKGCGATHQTGWTALAVRCIDKIADVRYHKDTLCGVD